MLIQLHGQRWKEKEDHQYKLLELTGNIAWSLIAPEIFLKGDPLEKFDWYS